MNLKCIYVYLHMDDENKLLLLEVIGEQYRQHNIKQNQGFMGFFNNIYKYYQRNQGEYQNIQQVNKKVVQESIGFIKKNITRYGKENGNTYYKEPKSNNTISLKQIDATDLRYVKDDKFEMKLKKKEDEFSGLMNSGKQNEIDFSFNTNEELPAADLNKLLGQTLQDREKELETIQNQYEKNGIEDATSWLKLNDNKKDKKGERKVTFNIEETSDNKGVNELLSKLKPIEKNEDKIFNILNTILNKQDEILNLLKKNETAKIEEKVEKAVDEKDIKYQENA